VTTAAGRVDLLVESLAASTDLTWAEHLAGKTAVELADEMAETWGVKKAAL
jgi:hypothetical protein